MVESPPKTYIAIDLKSFYASVECVDRNLDPLATNLVVADESRTEKTICLAVSPALKSHGIPGRARLFEVVQKVHELNLERLRKAPMHRFTGRTSHAPSLAANPALELGYIIAKPRMGRYLAVSSAIYGIYLKYVSPNDIHVYSIDEVFIDATQYLRMYGLDAHAFTDKLIHEVLRTTGITATAGIGPNLYLCKIAMDIIAKHIPADSNGVRIAELDEAGYRRMLWNHRPLTDFWRLGHGSAERLESCGIYTMGDVARMSVQNEEVLYRKFGVNAELLIDHAWGWEPCTIADIKGYRPETNSLSSGQVLQEPYAFDKGRLVVREMADLLSLDLVDKQVVTDQMELTVGYDAANLAGPEQLADYEGAVRMNRYGRLVPKEAHGTINLGKQTSSTRLIVQAVMALYDRIVDKKLLVRRMYVVANHIVREEDAAAHGRPVQPDLFDDTVEMARRQAQDKAALERERRQQQAVIAIKKTLGKNAILKGMNLDEGATARERNRQIGGHRA